MAGYLSKGFCTLESISDIVQTFLEVAGLILRDLNIYVVSSSQCTTKLP